MNVNGISSKVNSYYMDFLKNNSKVDTNIPLINPVESFVKGNTDKAKPENLSTQIELNNALNQKDANDALLLKNSAKPSVSFQDLQKNNDMNLLGNLNNNSINADNNVLSVYTSLVNGTFKPSVTSISTSNPFTLYNNVNAMMNQLQTSGNFLSTTV